jgi:hypothetical protein
VKKEVNRERKLPAFSLSLGELEVLWSRLTEQFDDPADIHARIQIRFSSEQLEFANFEELKQYPRLPPRATNFDVWLSQNERRITIHSQRRLGFRARVSATAETEAWCAGAIETVFSFLQSYKLWYSWFLSTPVFWVLNLMAIAPALAIMSTGGHPEKLHPFLAEHSIAAAIGWPGVVYAFLLLWLNNERLLPSAVIRISDNEGFIRKHNIELMVVGAVVTAVAAIITLIVTIAK